MKKGKEFIFPENVDKDYGIWKDYTLKDFGVAGLAGLIGLILIAIPPYGLILVLVKIVIIVLAMTVVMAILTIRPVAARKNIKVRDHFKVKRHYANSQKLFYLKPKKRGELSAFEKDQANQPSDQAQLGLPAAKNKWWERDHWWYELGGGYVWQLRSH